MRRFSFFVSLAVIIGSLLARELCAQTDWTAASSGTAQNLWGVCYGGGQFVAVGENGTIVTSSDGVTWTTRSSGTTVWLTSVTYALAHYIAVGDQGTVLSSMDGITWESVNARTPGTPAVRLNVVRFDGSEFLACGESDYSTEIFLPPALDVGHANVSSGTWWRGFATGLGDNVFGGKLGLLVQPNNAPYIGTINTSVSTAPIQNVTGVIVDHDAFVAVGSTGAIVSSTDGKTWVLQSSGTSANLQDIASFNNTLIVVGDAGTILSLDEHGAWTRRNAPTTQQLLGVAGSDTTAVVVGFGGTILRSPAAPMAPAILSSPLGLSETPGGAASFVVRASGSTPLSFQWYRNGLPLAGETRPTLTRYPLATSDAGDYSVAVTNAAGTVTSSVAKLTLLPAPVSIVDSSFSADSSLDGTPTALLPLADGSVLVAGVKGGQVVKLRSDGSLDPNWSISRLGPLGTAPVPYVNVLTAQPDGRILVGGSFSVSGTPAGNNLIRLNSDGTIDSTFTPAAEATASAVHAIVLQTDNRILVVNSSPTPLRLLADGRLDPTFLPRPLAPALTAVGQAKDWYVSFVAAAANGKVVVAAGVNLTFTNAARMYKFQILRLLEDGSVDSSFAPLIAEGTLSAMRVLNDDGVLAAGSNGFGFPNLGVVVRLRSDGTALPSYNLKGLDGYLSAGYIYADGSFLVDSSSQLGPLRYTSLGDVDPSFTGGIGHPSLIAASSSGQVFVAGDFSSYNGTPSQRVARLNAVSRSSFEPPRVLGFVADKTTVSRGESVTVRAAVTGAANLTFAWQGNALSGTNTTLTTTEPVLKIPITNLANGVSLTLTVSNAVGALTSAPIVFTVLPDPPVVTNQPTRVSAQSGRDLTLPIKLNSNAGYRLEYQWSHNGQLLSTLPWYYGSSLDLPKVSAADAGTYTLTIRNALGASVTSAPILLTIDDSSRFANLSTRAFAGPGEQTLIAGFSISGSVPRTVLLRGIGPSLAKFGVAGALADPQITLFSGASVYTHDYGGWDSNEDGGAFLRTTFAKLGAFPLDPGSKDTDIIATIAPGNYTVQLTSASGQTGTALIEIYEDDNIAARMLNVSSRAMVVPGSPAICGLSIQGPAPKRVLLRGIGPALSAFGISGVLVNPRLTLKDAGGTTVATNDDWETNSNGSELRVAIQSTGAFALPVGSKDAALLVNLAPGNYTMIVEGAPGQSGVALVEAYEVP